MLLRERVENTCDIGRAPAALASQFPSLDFSHLPDVWWHCDGDADHRGVCTEPIAVVQARVEAFRQQLAARPERAIAIVGHGTFLFQLTGRTFANCEVVDLVDLPAAERR